MNTIIDSYNDPSFIAGRLFYPLWLSLGLFLFVFRLEKREKFALILPLWILSAYIISFFIPMNTDYVPWNAIALLVSFVVGMHFAFKISWKSAVFFAMTSALLQNLSWHLSSGLVLVFIHRDITNLERLFPFSSWDYGLLFTISLLICYIPSYYLYIRPMMKKEEPEIKTWKFSLLAILILLIVYIVSNFFNLDDIQDSAVFRFAMTITCFSLLTALYTTAAVDKYEIDKQIMNSLFIKEQKHYEELASNMELMNKRAHDLKYQIKAMEDKNASEDIILELKESLKSYEYIPKTGNDALDNTLNDKIIASEKKQISFEYHVNAKDLNFMEPVDIYILFGNALDNAIEATEKQEDIQKRVIKMNSYRQGNILKFHIENNSFKKINISKNGIETSKSDRFFHGYGTKSMKEIVSRYNGTLAFSQKDNVFSVDIIFSVKE